MALKPEQIDQINIINWFNFTYPDLEPDMHHFANERKCTQQQGRTLKRMGVKKGVFDFFLAYPRCGYSGLWVELKVGGNKPTTEQLDFLARKSVRGYACAIVWGTDAAKHAIKDYLNGHDINSIDNKLKSCA